MEEKIKEKKKEKEISEFSFWKNFLSIFLISLISLGIIYGFLGLYEEGFIEGFIGVVIFVFVLAIIFTLFAKWWRDYKLTGRWLSLGYRKIKWWQPSLVILLLLFSTFTVLNAFFPLEDDYEPFYQIEEWNPDGYYG